MEAELLKDLAGFESLPPAALTAAAAATRRLVLPARRWLIRPGRSLSDHYYLLEGRVRVIHTGEVAVVTAPSRRTRLPLYPGAAGIETLTAAVFAGVAPGLLAALHTEDWDTEPAMLEVSLETSCWQQRFLTSPLMQRLSPAAWQRVLRATTRHSVHAGERIVTAGDPATCCFVLCSGSADIRAADGGGRLATLGSGNLFGEDALVTGSVRNADVVMRTDGHCVSLPGACFERWLLNRVVQPLARPGDRLVVGLDPGSPAALRTDPGALRETARRLARHRRYAVVGGSHAERRLAAFLFAEQGLDARPLEP